ncbi:MAG TPA: helix-turn-helix domain-containing protein [Gemmatimonadaceae bacterium]|nr:helix-turn-helix domain-containing protein [Gemmatimonadaceae bacterium]
MAARDSLIVEAVVTPRFDIFYALYTLTADASSPLGEWKEAARQRLSRDLDRIGQRLAPLPIFWPLLADALQRVPGEISFDEIVKFLERIPPADLQRDVLSGIFHDGATVEALVSARRSLKQVLGDEDLHGTELAGHFGLRPYSAESAAVKTIAYLLNEPEEYRNDLVSALRLFWENGFGEDWTSIEPQLRAEVVSVRKVGAESKPEAVLGELDLPIAFDDVAREIRPRAGSPIRYSRIDRCYVVPSAFNTRKWWAKYETKNGTFAVYLPAFVRVRIANLVDREKPKTNAQSAPAVRVDAEAVFRALGDTTRYAIASILARKPTTSAELARSLKVSKPTITHHVQTLRAAGLLSEETAGGSTMLTLRQDTLAALSAAAVSQLFESTADLALATTRKRRTS